MTNNNLFEEESDKIMINTIMQMKRFTKSFVVKALKLKTLPISIHCMVYTGIASKRLSLKEKFNSIYCEKDTKTV